MKYLFIFISLLFFALLSCSTDQPLTPDEDVESVEETRTDDITDEHPPAFQIEVVDLADIVADTKAGNTNYEGRLLTVNATTIVYIEVIPDGNSVLAINTKDDQVGFYITTENKFEAFADYEIGDTDDFTVYIRNQRQETEDRFAIWAFFSKKGVEDVTLDTLLTDAKENNGRYEGCVVRFKATVRDIDLLGDLTIDTLQNEVAFVLTEKSKYDPDTQYVVNGSYTFTVILTIIGDGKPDSIPYITCHFIKQPD